MTFTAARQHYFEQLKIFRAFQSAESILSWDQETHLPAQARSERGETMSVLAGFLHNLFVDPKFVMAVETLGNELDQMTALEQRSVKETLRDLRKSKKLSQAFVEKTNAIMNAAHTAWFEARQKNDYSLYASHLQKVIENRREYAELINSEKAPYDVCLDDYEEGMTTAKYRPIFTQLKSGLKELLPKIMAAQHHDASKNTVENPLNIREVSEAELQPFLKEMITTIGFDLERGAIGKVEHPFEISVSHNDVRLNTRFKPHEASFTILGMIHELGHGLYEQNTNAEYIQYGLSHGVSLGVHESQSRFLENVIGRSAEFWQYFLPRLQKLVPAYQDVKMDELLTALNKVEPTLIRTEADEVTYNVHIVLRFELEQMMMSGEVQARELPELWRAQMKELLGIEPKDDLTGVLQDVHWSWGNIGYFPTYTLGNLLSAQLLHSFTTAHPNWRAEVAKGDFSSYMKWFKTNVWQHGGLYEPQQLITKATGEDLNPKYFMEYLQSKYLG